MLGGSYYPMGVFTPVYPINLKLFQTLSLSLNTDMTFPYEFFPNFSFSHLDSWLPYRVVTSQNLVPAKFYKNLIQSTELSCNSGIL